MSVASSQSERPLILADLKDLESKVRKYESSESEVRPLVGLADRPQKINELQRQAMLLSKENESVSRLALSR